MMSDKILEFIKRRFPDDCNWTSGNCYYFALILQSRFGGDIVYDPIDGHFMLYIDGQFYDYYGVHIPYAVEPWPNYPDELEKERIIEGCIK